ncbi:hypothetical protein FACS189440_15440 [Bacteroidia bacterium]|nr:hypothetical protein FACS189423_02280 [Bacteroidia bacterium]GHT49532.1 hypothetical protein FACS189440_15440 [Bacteroidia bacterium]
MEAEFNEFRKLKTEKEKEAFYRKRKADFEKKTQEEKQTYNEATQIVIKAIGKRVEELIERAELGAVVNIRKNLSLEIA